MLSAPPLDDVRANGLSIAQEGAVRFREFASWLECRGDSEAAALFIGMAEKETRLEQGLASQGRDDKASEAQAQFHGWLGEVAVPAQAYAFVLHLMSAWHAIHIALAAKRRAHAFMEGLAVSLGTQEGCALASRIALAQQQQIAALEAALATTPRPRNGEGNDAFPLH